jgi:two-component system NtrC family response regulator
VINLPPLRERENDVRLLANEFLRRASAKVGKNGLEFDHEALRALNSHSWPGNVRELDNRVKRAVIMADGKRLTVEDLELGGLEGMPRATTLKEAREALEREMIQKMLRKHSGKIAPAAAELGVSRPTLYELMDKLGLKRE